MTTPLSEAKLREIEERNTREERHCWLSSQPATVEHNDRDALLTELRRLRKGLEEIAAETVKPIYQSDGPLGRLIVIRAIAKELLNAE